MSKSEADRQYEFYYHKKLITTTTLREFMEEISISSWNFHDLEIINETEQVHAKYTRSRFEQIFQPWGWTFKVPGNSKKPEVETKPPGNLASPAGDQALPQGDLVKPVGDLVRPAGPGKPIQKKNSKHNPLKTPPSPQMQRIALLEKNMKLLAKAVMGTLTDEESEKILKILDGPE